MTGSCEAIERNPYCTPKLIYQHGHNRFENDLWGVLECGVIFRPKKTVISARRDKEEDEEEFIRTQK